MTTIEVLETRHGLHAHDRTDQVIGESLRRYGEWAEEEIFLTTTFLKPGDTVIDLGANVGCHTVAYSRAVGPGGRVVAIDGQRRATEFLTLNLLLNGLSNVARIEGLAGCREGVTHLRDEAAMPTGNIGGMSFKDDLNGKAGWPVSMFTVDSLALPGCRLMKIDVEGMEADVLAGAVETIARFRPVIYFEQTSAVGFAGIVRQLRDGGYRLHWHVANPFNRNNFRGDQLNIFGGTCEVNVLALPGDEATVPPASIELHPVEGSLYNPPASSTGLGGWSLPGAAYRAWSPPARRSVIDLPLARDVVSRESYDQLQASFLDLQEDRVRAQLIMTHQADVIGRLQATEVT